MKIKFSLGSEENGSFTRVLTEGGTVVFRCLRT